MDKSDKEFSLRRPLQQAILMMLLSVALALYPDYHEYDVLILIIFGFVLPELIVWEIYKLRSKHGPLNMPQVLALSLCFIVPVGFAFFTLVS